MANQEYINTDRGVLYRNENKSSDNHPDYSGSVNVGGVDFWLSAWVKESKKDSKKFFSLSVRPKTDVPKAAKPAKVADINDDIPF